MNSTPNELCECCGAEIRRETWRGVPVGHNLRGLCNGCSSQLGGGKHSAKIVKSEARAIAERRVR